MSDNLFERLFELLQTPGPINWALAREVAGTVTGSPQPIEPRLAEEYQELTLAAQLNVTGAAPLPISGAGPINPVDKSGWIAGNIESLLVLAEPIKDRMGSDGLPGPMGDMMGQLAPAILGMQMGSLAGLITHGALGQFDVGLPLRGKAAMYLIVPNVEGFAASHALDASQVRLWAAMNEVVHTSLLEIDWYGGHFRTLLGDYFSQLEFDPQKMTEALGALSDPSAMQDMLGDSAGVAALLSGDGSEGLAPLQAFLAFTEGYRTQVVARAGKRLLPQLESIESALWDRNSEPNQADLFVTQFVGIDLARQNSKIARDFCDQAARSWGIEAIDDIWNQPTKLPSLAELSDPVGWAARTLLD